MLKYLFIILLLVISTYTIAQKPKKIFSSLKEGNIIEAQLEYDKISSENKHKEKEIILFKIANSLLMIDPTSNSYNPIESIVNFNKIFISTDEKEDIIKFLEKYELGLSKISERIHSEIVVQAKKLNSIESYNNALQVCTENNRLELLQLKEIAIYRKIIIDRDIIGYKAFIMNYPQSKYKDEIQSLLERNVLDVAKKNKLVGELNSFLTEYSNSSLKQEATDFRDSIILSKVTNEYDAMLAFTIEYPNSVYTNEIQLKLSDLLYKESIELNTIESLKRFIKEFPNDIKVKSIKEKLAEIKYEEISINKINNMDINCGFNVLHNFYDGLASVELYNKHGYVDNTGKVVIPLIYDNIYDFQDGLANVQLNKKHGLIDKTGKIIIPLIYDRIYNYSDNLYCIVLNGKSGLIDKTGKIIIPIIYDKVYNFSDDLHCIVELNEKRGYIDKTGKIIIPPIYDEINKFHDGLSKVELNKKQGLIDTTGKIVIPIIYDNIYDFQVGLAKVELNKKYGLIDKNGKVVVPEIYDVIGLFYDSLARVELNDKLGYIDKTGKIIIPIIYDCIKVHCDNYFDFFNGLVCVKLNDKLGYIDKTGKIIIPIIYDDIGGFIDGLAWIVLNGKYGYIDITGKVVIPIIYDDCWNDENYYEDENGKPETVYHCHDTRYNFADGIVSCSFNCYTEHLTGLIDKTGNEIIPIGKYIHIGKFCDGLAPVIGLNGKIGYIDKTGKVVIPVIYDFESLGYYFESAECFFHDGFTRVLLNKKHGLIDKTGKIILPIIYDNIRFISNSDVLAGFELNKKGGYIDKTGKIIIPAIYDEIGRFHDGLAWVLLNKKYGLIDKTGKIILPIIYDMVHHFQDDLALVVLNKKYGLIDKNGKLVVPAIYDEINEFHDGLARVELNEKSGIIDKTGKVIIPVIYDYLSTIYEDVIIAKKGCEYFILKLNL
jgi:hypothetical protein